MEGLTVDRSSGISADRDLKERLKKVQAWLHTVFDESSIPQYEINQSTVPMLYKLMQTCQEREQESRLMAEDLAQKTEEYNAEADRLSRIMESVGLSPCSLSQSGTVSLRTLRNVASVLELVDAVPTNYYLAMLDMTSSLMTLEDSRHEEEGLSQKLFNETKTAIIKADSLKKATVSLEEQAKQQEPQLEDKVRQAGFYQSKAREYDSQLRSLQTVLADTGVTSSEFHQSLVKLSQDLEALDAELSPLKNELNSYEDLPPNISLARVKVEEAKRELSAMEAELSKNIDMIHM